MCRRPGNEELRTWWGCDDTAEQPFARLECPRCLGYDPKCELCEGHQDGVPMSDCPYRVLPRHIQELVAWYGDWDKGRLPMDGGLLDQSAGFVDAMRTIDAAVSRHLRAEQKKREEDAETTAADLRRQFGGGQKG